MKMDLKKTGCDCMNSGLDLTAIFDVSGETSSSSTYIHIIRKFGTPKNFVPRILNIKSGNPINNQYTHLRKHQVNLSTHRILHNSIRKQKSRIFKY